MSRAAVGDSLSKLGLTEKARRICPRSYSHGCRNWNRGSGSGAVEQAACTTVKDPAGHSSEVGGASKPHQVMPVI